MNKIFLSRHITILLYLLIFLFMLTSLVTPLRIGGLVKYSIVFLISIMSIYLLTLRHFSLRKALLFIPLLIFVTIYIFNSSFTSKSFFLIFYQLTFIFFSYFLSSITWKKNQIKLLACGSFILTLVLLIITLTGMPELNPNTLAAYSYLFMFPILIYISWSKNGIRPKFAMMAIAIPISTIFLSGSRSILLSLSAGVLTYMIWKILSKNKVAFKIYFLIVMMIIYFLVVIYPNLENHMTNFYKYEQMSLELTGKSLLSGRNEIWSTLVDLIKQKPFFGYGSDISINDIIGEQLSAHNLYIQISLQVGIIGLSAFIIFLLFVWNAFWFQRQQSRVAISASFFIGLIVHQTFEVTLTQNNFAIGLIQWMIIGISLSFCLNNNSTVQDN